MKRMSALVALLSLFAVPVGAQEGVDHTAVVAAVKADLVAKGVDLSSPNDTKPCNVFQITRRVAWILRGEGIGFVKKGGNNCEGHSVDALMYRDGTVIDTLIGSGQANTPAWNNVGTRPITDWDAPTDPGDTPPPPPPPTVDLAPLLARLDALERHDRETDARVQSAATAAAAAGEQAGAFESRIVALEHRPTVTGCKASIRLGVGGIPIACEVTK